MPPPGQNHESALTDKPLKPERTQTYGAIIADFKSYVVASAQGIHSGGGAGGFVWLVTDALGRFGVVATYDSGTLFIAERGQSLAPHGVELGGIYEPATPVPPNQLLPSVVVIPAARRQKRAHFRRAHARPHPALLTCGTALRSLLRIRGSSGQLGNVRLD